MSHLFSPRTHTGFGNRPPMTHCPPISRQFSALNSADVTHDPWKPHTRTPQEKKNLFQKEKTAKFRRRRGGQVYPSIQSGFNTEISIFRGDGDTCGEGGEKFILIFPPTISGWSRDKLRGFETDFSWRICRVSFWPSVSKASIGFF